MRTRFKPLALAAAALVALAGAACSGPAEPAKPEPGEITVYSGRGESLVGELFKEFEQSTGIKVNVRYGDTAAMAAQLLEEGDKSPADVFLAQDAGALGAVAKKGLFAKLPAEVLSQVPQPYQARSGEWVGVTGRSRVMVYNTDQVPAAELPKSVFDLADPKWKGKVGIAPNNGSFQAFVTAMRVQHGDDKTRQFLTGLKANEPQIRENNTLIVNDVNDGKLAAGLVNHYYLFGVAKEQGKPIDQMKAQNHFFADGDTGALVNISGVGLLKKAATNPDARKLIDYLLGTPGQTYFAQKTSEYPMLAGVQTVPGLQPIAQLEAPDIDLNDLDTLQATVAMIKDSGLA